jgi:hypothetical protein
MKYMLILNGRKTDFEDYARWSKEELQTNAAFLRAFDRELKDSGVFLACGALGWPSEAMLVRAGSNGEPITDGVFPESREFLARYWIIDVESAEEACVIASRLLQAPGAGGKSGSRPVEVRLVLSNHSDSLCD